MPINLINFAGYSQPPRVPAGTGATVARTRRAATAARQPLGSSRYHVWGGLDIYSPLTQDFIAWRVLGSSDYSVSVIECGVSLAGGAYLTLNDINGTSHFNVGLDGCFVGVPFGFNTSLAPGSGKNIDATFGGVNKQYVLFIDGSNDSVSIGSNASFPGLLLYIDGNGATTGRFAADRFYSSPDSGTDQPYGTDSAYLNTNLNADLLDGNHASAFAAASHALLGSNHSDVLAGTVTVGDIIVANATPKWSILAANATATNKFLRSVSGGVASWETVISFGTVGQIPYTNSGATGFDYGGLTYNGTSFSIVWATATCFEVKAGETVFGSGAAGQDYVCTFTGETNSGEFKWMEDEDYFSFTDGIMIPAGEEIYFRDSAIYLFSQADGYLNVVADSGVRIGDATPTNYTQFDSTGHQTMAGTAKPWEDLRLEPVARTTGANAPTFEKWLDDSAGTSRGVYLYSFDDANNGSEKEVFFTMQMPHEWDGGPISMHIHWIGAVDDTTADPRWGLEYAWKDIGEVFGDTVIVYSDGTHVTPAGADPDVTARKHYITEFADLTPGSTADGLSSILIGRLFRDSANAADTYNAAGAKCGLLYIDAHYQKNSLGSTDEYVK